MKIYNELNFYAKYLSITTLIHANVVFENKCVCLTGYEREADAVDARTALDVVGSGRRRDVHVEPDVPLEHAGSPGTPVLHPERHRAQHAVAEVRNLQREREKLVSL